VVGAATWELIKDVADATPLGGLDLKGKAEPVEAYELHRLRG
jgi:class 3 adenylate cyclase